jgi:ankyrin repeat protein
MLVRSGVHVDVRMARHGTPLHIAAVNGHAATIAALVDMGADVRGKEKAREENGEGGGG